MKHCATCGCTLNYLGRCANPQCMFFNLYQRPDCENSQSDVTITTPTEFESQVLQKLDTITVALQSLNDLMVNLLREKQ